MERAAWIAVQARRLALLSYSPERDGAALDRAESAVAKTRQQGAKIGHHPLDAILVGSASDLDLICARAVAKLNHGETPLILDELPPDHVLAIYYAATDPHRGGRAVLTDEALENAPAGVKEYMEELEAMSADRLDDALALPDLPSRRMGPRGGGLSAEEQRAFEDFNVNALRRLLGLGYELSAEGLAALEVGEVLVAELLGPESDIEAEIQAYLANQ